MKDTKFVWDKHIADDCCNIMQKYLEKINLKKNTKKKIYLCPIRRLTVKNKNNISDLFNYSIININECIMPMYVEKIH